MQLYIRISFYFVECVRTFLNSHYLFDVHYLSPYALGAAMRKPSNNILLFFPTFNATETTA